MLYAGVPVITTPVGDANLYLKDKVNAFIVKEGDIDELANAISLAFENPKLCREIGLNGKKNFYRSNDGCHNHGKQCLGRSF